jgi:peptide deformylase
MTQPPELLDIIVYPDPFLAKAARAITPEELAAGKAGEWNLAELAERMQATMYAHEGVGLAATQVRVGLRLFVADITDDRNQPFAVLNSVLTDTRGSMVNEEGCLSVPGVRAKVKRYKSLRLTGVDLKGEPLTLEASDLLARVCQHETDHLNGVLFINRVGMTGKLAIRRKLIELEEDYALAQKKR